MSAEDRELLLADARAQLAQGKPVTVHRIGDTVDPEKRPWELLLGRPVEVVHTSDLL